MILLPLILATLQAAPAAAPAAANPDDAPRWLTRPSQRDLDRVYPRQAFKRGEGGRTMIKCKATAQGRLTACEVISEDPAGEGFGQALLSMAPSFSMTPVTPSGRSVEGTSITIPFRFLAR